MTAELSNKDESVCRARIFDTQHVIHEIKHYLPSQAALKDFIHHNTLHAFQQSKFFDAIRTSSAIFGHRVSLPLQEYRNRFEKKEISEAVLDTIIKELKGEKNFDQWKQNVLFKEFNTCEDGRIGKLREQWNIVHDFDMDAKVHPLFFRVLCSYLDQGISIWDFPIQEKGFLATIRELETISYSSFFRTKRAKELLKKQDLTIEYLLGIIVGNKEFYEQYLFDQQFSHHGWSGLVSAIEDDSSSLLNVKPISIEDVIKFELLLEIDALENGFGSNWQPLCEKIDLEPVDLFAPVPSSELTDVIEIWQKAFEWTYYNQVLFGIKATGNLQNETSKNKSFQVLFCIDDRECSIRRYVEQLDANAETFGTPGFFSVEFYFQPDGGKFYEKLCPAPVTPKFLIKEVEINVKRKSELLQTKSTHKFLIGDIVTFFLGLLSSVKLVLTVFRPKMSPSISNAFEHMQKKSKLTIENTSVQNQENGLQIGFTIEEMTTRVEGLLRGIGLTKDFAPLVYLIAHGSSSANNPHHGAHECGACSGRPGSVNARVFAFMANHSVVRANLEKVGIVIPVSTQFVGGLHDTCADEMDYFDEDVLNEKNTVEHLKNVATFENALDLNAKERSRKFNSISSVNSIKKVRKDIKDRSVTLFEPRPELGHGTNTLCIVGRRNLTKHLFLDRRAFLNSYDYTTDPEGKLLTGIIRPLGPVCGGINLEYYFSRVDSSRFGSGTKLPHNVMGLIGVANGCDGDLRPGLPIQMTEVHDPIRLLIIIEHKPEVLLNVIKSSDAIYEWYNNEWINIVASHPETKEMFVFKNGAFIPYQLIETDLKVVKNLDKIMEVNSEALPVYILN